MTDEKRHTDLIIGKWYVYREDATAVREQSIIAGPFDALLDAERFILPNEAVPSQYGIFQHRESS